VTISNASTPVPTPAQLQAALLAYISDSARDVGPFRVLLDTTSAMPGRNYAVPTSARPPAPDEVAELVAVMRSADRQPRFEHVAPHPALELALALAGFKIVRRLPLMILGPHGLRPLVRVPNVAIRAAVDNDMLPAARVQGEAYDDPADPRETASRLRHNAATGGAVMVAVDLSDSMVVGTGLATPPGPGEPTALSEIAAVAVTATHRRRGIGAAIGFHLTTAVHGMGAVPFLQVEEPAEQRIYERIGYIQIGEMHETELPN